MKGSIDRGLPALLFLLSLLSFEGEQGEHEQAKLINKIMKRSKGSKKPWMLFFVLSIGFPLILPYYRSPCWPAACARGQAEPEPRIWRIGVNEVYC
jgi:hypothetical protein